jgi:imidazolonepropionase
MKLLIKNIKTLVQAESTPRNKVSGKEMGLLPCINDAWLAIEDELLILVKCKIGRAYPTGATWK